MGQTNAAEDSIDQRTVLDHILDQHPTLLRYSDLILYLTGVPVSSDEGRVERSAGFFLKQDAVDRALRELVRNGALYEKADGDSDPWIAPTPTAIYLEGLPAL